MRILVVSDSHGDEYSLIRAIKAQPSAEIVVHCGDGADEASRICVNFLDKMVVSVKGNCDFCSSAPISEVFTAEGVKFFVTHGHAYNAKSTLYNLSLAAREQGAQVVLFGHTHNPLSIYDDGLYMLNPGSLRGYASTYGFVDVTKKGIVTNIVELK